MSEQKTYTRIEMLTHLEADKTRRFRHPLLGKNDELCWVHEKGPRAYAIRGETTYTYCVDDWMWNDRHADGWIEIEQTRDIECEVPVLLCCDGFIYTREPTLRIISDTDREAIEEGTRILGTAKLTFTNVPASWKSPMDDKDSK